MANQRKNQKEEREREKKIIKQNEWNSCQKVIDCVRKWDYIHATLLFRGYPLNAYTIHIEMPMKNVYINKSA